MDATRHRPSVVDEVADAIERIERDRDKPPTIAELLAALHWKSRSQLQSALDRLVKSGRVIHEPGRWRCYRKTDA